MNPLFHFDQMKTKEWGEGVREGRWYRMASLLAVDVNYNSFISLSTSITSSDRLRQQILTGVKDLSGALQ